MLLMSVTKKGSMVKKGLKFFNFGAAGTWKSSFALDFMKMKSEEGKPLRVLYIDCETGSVDNYLEDLANQGIDLDNLLLVYTTSYSEVEEYALKAINNEDFYDEDGNVVLDAEKKPFNPDVIVLDGLTVLTDNVKFAAINVSEKRAKIKADTQGKTATEKFVAEQTAGLEFKDHDKIKMKGKTLVRSLITGTDKYVIVTAREKTKKEMQNVDGKMELVSLGVIPDCWDGTEYEFYTVLRHFEDEDGVIKAQVWRKDRTKVFAQNEIISEPTPLLWQIVINNNLGKDVTVIKNKVEDDILKDEKNIMGVSEVPEEDNSIHDTTNELTTIEDYTKAIDDKMQKLTPVKKKALKPSVEKAGLPLNYKTITDLGQIKKFYELISQ
jgi:hypothetical protein